MKKQYQKPCVTIENFALSEYIAGGCGNIGETFSTTENCATNYDYDELLKVIGQLTGNSGTYTFPDGSIIKFCKHGSQGLAVFTS